MAEFSNPDDQSAFNMALAMLYRIDKVLTHISVTKLQGDLQGWYAGLFSLKGEVYYVLKTEERKAIDELFKEVSPLISELTRRTRLGSHTQDPKLIRTLEMMETKLKEYMEARGMLGVKKKDPRFALSSGM